MSPLEKLERTLALLREYKEHTFNWQPGEEMEYAMKIQAIWEEVPIVKAETTT